MVHTHGQTKFHGPTQPGTFQTGRAEIIKFWSAHHIEETGVISTRQNLVDDGLLATTDLTANAIVIAGVTYAIDANYDSALAAQHNFLNVVAHFAQVANVVSLNITDGLATGTSPTADFANVFLGVGADTFGTELIETNGLIWSCAVVLEQKGILHNSGGTAAFVKGEPSIGATGGNFGSTVADVEEFLNEVILYQTGLLAIGGDLENMADADTTGAFLDGVNITNGVAGAFGGAIGDQVSGITNFIGVLGDRQGTSQTLVVDPTFVAQDLQS